MAVKVGDRVWFWSHLNAPFGQREKRQGTVRQTDGLFAIVEINNPQEGRKMLRLETRRLFVEESQP